MSPCKFFGLALLCALAALPRLHAAEKAGQTVVTIQGEAFHINGLPTYAGRSWKGHKIEGLLLNSRMVQGIFDDMNPETAKQWAYPDTGVWDAERNTREFIAAMSEWRRHGLLAVTMNLQGGSPQGYSNKQPWENNAFTATGELRPAYMARLERVLRRADELGMVVILGYFYFGQDERLQDEAAVLRATDNATAWLLERGFRNVLVEVNNECNVRYDHAILKPERVHELIGRIKQQGKAAGLLVSTSYGGGTIPKPNVAKAADFLLLHGNGVSDPRRITEMVRQTRAVEGYRPMPIVFNEDDHFDFEKPLNNFVSAIQAHASWGYFDFRMKEEGFDEGYQSVPVNWAISSTRKRGFFGLLAEISGTGPAARGARGEKITVTSTNHHGWTNALWMSNGKVYALVVPEIGRVMQFGFVGGSNVFWENPRLFGRAASFQEKEWQNFGGDKTWPAPESEWGRFTRRSWRPPPAFDALPVQATNEAGSLLLTSAVDEFYGIRVRRRIALEPGEPTMTIVTDYERVTGEPAAIGIWVITQVEEPERIFLPAPQSSRFTNGFVELMKPTPPDLLVTNGLISLSRAPSKSHKIGSDADRLLWMNAQFALLVEAPRQAGAEYPDQGSSAEVYTNPDPLRYIELETLGPLHRMAPGDRISATNRYTLFRRSTPNAETEAQKILSRQTR